MPSLALGLGLSKNKTAVYSGLKLDAQAVAHYDRVIADGGIIPAGLLGCSNYISGLKSFRGVTTLDTSNTCALKQAHYLGLKLATGTGATAGNRACAKYYDLLGASYDAEQTTAANQPLALVNTGSTYVWLPGVNGNYFTTPNAVGNQMTADFTIDAYVNLSSISATNNLTTKYNTNSDANFVFRVTASLVQINFVVGGIYYTYQSTTVVPFTANQWYYIRVTRNSTTGLVKFFTSSDNITWVQLGSNVAGVTGTITNTNTPVQIGTIVGVNAVLGEIGFIKYYKDDTATTVTQFFNPALYNRLTSQTTCTATTGEVWTINTPATNNALKAEFVDTTMIMGNGTAYGLRAAALNITQSAITNYTIFKKFTNSVGGQMVLELGNGSGQGKYLFMPTTPDREEFGIKANVGNYNGLYINSSLGLKLATYVNNIANANESGPYLINNVSQTLGTSTESANNTAAMNATGYNYLARNNAASLWFNGILVSDAVFVGEDDAAKFLATYNFLKTYTNGI